MSETTQPTIFNKMSNATNAVTNDRGIHPLPIILPLLGLVVIGIAVLVAWKNRRGMQRCFGRRGCKCFICASFYIYIQRIKTFSKNSDLLDFLSSFNLTKDKKYICYR